MSFKKYYYLVATFLFLSISIHIVQSYFSIKSVLMDSINEKLLQSAKVAPLILPPNFHHHGMLQEKITPQLDRINIDRLSEQAKFMGIEYIYTMVKKDNKIIFTSSSATDQELASNENLSHYGDVYDEATPILFHVFESRLLAYDDSTDKWGSFHSIYVPMLSNDGMLYVVGADFDLAYLNEKLLENLLNSLRNSLVYLLLLIPFFIIYHKTKEELEKIILERTKELQQQKYALDAHSIVAITDIKGTITFVNKKFEEISGYSHDELIGKNHRILNSSTHDSSFWKEMYYTVRHGNVWHDEVKNKAKDGSYYWVDTTIVPFLDAKGKPESYISIRTDITSLKNSREIIARKEELLQTLLDSVSEGIYGIDDMGNCTFVNKSFLRILGYDQDEQIVGKQIHDLIHYSHRDGTHYPIHDCKIEKANHTFESVHVDDEVFWKSDGTCIDVEYRSYPMLRNDKYTGAVTTFIDTTEQNKHKKEYKEYELQMIKQARLAQMGEMISMIAHQWRQPLAAISSTVVNIKLKIELESFDLETQIGRDAQNHFLIKQFDKVETYIENLTTTIDDFRNFYKADKKAVLTSFHVVVNKALVIIRNSMEADNIELIEEYENDILIKMYDNEMLQVILNILKNAQDNFNEKSISHPQIKIVSNNKSLFICDNGGGIPSDILEKIFDPYFSTKNEKNGTGLGLHMSKTIIDNHHKGKLIAYNQNDGVCFEINLENANVI